MQQTCLNQGWIYRDRVTRPSSLVDYYATHYTHSSAAEWRDRIAAGQICVDGTPILDCETPLQPGQRLTYDRPPWAEPAVPFNVSVLYEDDDLLLIDKPSGLPVLPGGGFLQNTLTGWLQQHYATPPIPMHRLGRGTSGVLLLAKTTTARTALSQAFRDRQMQKIYRTLATGSDQPETFTVDCAIGKVPHPSLGYLYAASATGKPAVSHCRVLVRDRIPGASLLEVNIPTGRPHQIRIHLAAAGYPLWGDPLYGKGGTAIDTSSVPGDCGYHLHAYRICFTHPMRGEILTIAAPPPPLLEPS
jgi:23S rRNA pseudouridine1911/1915/1917 synthase